MPDQPATVYFDGLVPCAEPKSRLSDTGQGGSSLLRRCVQPLNAARRRSRAASGHEKISCPQGGWEAGVRRGSLRGSLEAPSTMALGGACRLDPWNGCAPGNRLSAFSRCPASSRPALRPSVTECKARRDPKRQPACSNQKRPEWKRDKLMSYLLQEGLRAEANT